MNDLFLSRVFVYTNKLSKFILNLGVTILLSFNYVLVGQNLNLVVLDSITQEAVPYATVTISQVGGEYTSSNGSIKNIHVGDTLLISHMEYNDKIVVAKQINEQIFLSRKSSVSNQLNNIDNFGIKKTIGYLHNKSHLERSGSVGSEIGVYIPNEKKQIALIRKILIDLIFTSKYLDKKKFVNIFKLNIYRARKKMIAEQINKKPIIISSRGESKRRIDISDYKIKFPSEGAFITIEWIGAENMKTKQMEMIKGVLNPFLGLARQPKNIIVYKRNRLSDNTWRKQSYSSHIECTKDYIPRISIVVSYPK